MATFILLIIYLTFICLGLPDSLLGSSWPAMRLELGVRLDMAGFINIVTAAGTVISSLSSERIIKRFGTGTVTAASVLLTAAATFGISQTGSYIWIILLAAPLGLGAGAIDVALNNYVSLRYSARHMSWLHCFWGIGAFTGPLIIASFLTSGKWRGGYITVSIILGATALLLFTVLPVWRKHESTGVSADLTDDPADSLQASESNIKVLCLRGVKPAMLTFVCYCGIEYTFGLWGASFLVSERGVSEPSAAVCVSLYYIGITTGRLISGFLSAKLNSLSQIRFGIWILAGAVAVILFPVPSAILFVLFFAAGIGSAPIFPSMIHETPRRFGASRSRRVIGLQMAASYTGGIILPPLFGFIAARAGMFIFPIFLSVYLIGMYVCSERANKVTEAVK